MGIPELILGIIEQILKLGVLGVEEGHKYEDNRLRIQRKYADEYRRPSDEISDANLIEYERELLLLGQAIELALKTKNSKN